MKELHLPVEVDPVSDARWNRLEREMFAKLDASGGEATPVRRRAPATAQRLRWLAYAAAAAAAAALVIAHPWGGARSIERMRLATTDGASQFTVGDSSLVVAPHSLVMVDGDDDHGIDVVLDRGAVTCEVAPRRGRPPFVVDSGDVRVRVIGTKFAVARDSDGTTVEVDHGVVEVTARGLVTMLHDGERWPASSSAASPAPKAESPGAAEVPPAATAVVAPVLGPAPSLAPFGARARAATPGFAASSSGSDPSASRPGPQESHMTTASASNPPTPAEAANVAPPANAAPSPQDVFEGAARIERSRPDEAAAAYQQLALSRTAWAPTALFALARLDAEHGRKAEAIRLLNEYLTRYPRGVNADDARSLLARIQ